MRVKRCTGCKKELPISNYNKDRSLKTGYKPKCRGCTKKAGKKYRKTVSYKSKLPLYATKKREIRGSDPIKKWVDTAYYNAKRRAKCNNLEFSLTREWLYENLVAVCPLLGTLLVYNGNKPSDASASIDRKDSTGGYTPDNCRVISLRANRIKNNATQEELQRIAESLLNY